MIPLGDVIPVRTRPFVVLVVIALTLAAGGSILQLAGNLLVLALFGRTLEDRMSHGRFAVFVIACAWLSAMVQSFAVRNHVVIAAAGHGAAASIVGAYFSLYAHSKVLVLVPVGLSLRIVEVQAVVFLALWYLLQVAGAIGSSIPSAVPGFIPSWAHAAGVVAGAGLARVFRRRERERVEWWNEVVRGKRQV
jgi:membrane associated rhomboid family serine protease